MRRGLAAAVAGAVVALSFGAPVAWAAPGPNVTVATVAVAMSSGNANPPLLSGHFHVDDPAATVTVVVKMSWTGADPDHHPKFNQQNVCPGAQCMNDGQGNYDIAGFALPPALYNGPYHVDATATATNIIGQSNVRTAGADFSVAVAPPPVTAVTASVDKKTRDVAVSWDRDATTPDVQSYYLWRKGPGEKDFTAIYSVPQLNTGARVTVVDQGQHLKGGDYTYEIETRRNGGTGDSASYVGSDRTKSQSNVVTVPAPAPGQTVTPTTTPKPGGAPPVVQGTPSGVNRNSNFSGSSSSGGSSSATTPTSEAVTPDPGFVRGLPEAGSNPGADQNSEEGDNSAVAVTPGRHSSSGRGYLIPAAGAAVLVLGAIHLRMFKKKLDEPPSNLTPVG
jgi:hypothetical protein